MLVFSAGTFYPAFEMDCRKARREIVVFSPYMTERGTGRWIELWRSKISEGVGVRLVVRPPGDQGGFLEHGLTELIDAVREIGVVIDQRARMHEKLAIIDGDILWHGSLNILSHRDTSESMLRVESPGACAKVETFVAGRKWGKDVTIEFSRAENPNCGICQKPMIWNHGRFGIWFECTCGQKADNLGRPQKKQGSKASPKPSQPTSAATGLGNCPICGKPLAEKTGRFGRFVSCSGYPVCNYKPSKQGMSGKPKKTSNESRQATAKATVQTTGSRPFPEPPKPQNSSTSSNGSQVTTTEIAHILQAMEKAREPLGVTLLSVKSGINEKRLKEILPILVRQGTLVQIASRYSKNKST
jgi:ssDNA-binding Zn-finger/Zn-ribbon topoisomerase 1